MSAFYDGDAPAMKPSIKPMDDAEIEKAGEAMVAVFGDTGSVPHRFKTLLEQAREANALRDAILDLTQIQHARHKVLASLTHYRRRANNRSKMFHHQEMPRRYWNSSAGTGPSFSTVAEDSTMALVFLALYCAECFPDEVIELDVKEVSEADALQQAIRGDNPCMLVDMPYGDVACSEY